MGFAEHQRVCGGCGGPRGRRAGLCRACRFPALGTRACGWCAETFEPRRKKQRFCSPVCAARYSADARTPLRGADNPRYKGGLTFHRTLGRWQIVCRDGSNVYFARAVMEAELGRPLSPDEHVHHINRDKTDDRPENLRTVSNREHAFLHNEERKAALRAWHDARKGVAA